MEFKKVYNDFLNETLWVGKHESGLPVVILEKPEFVKFYAVISTKYGSNNAEFRCNGENEFISIPDGTAHFLEHKLFEQPDGTNAFRSTEQMQMRLPPFPILHIFFLPHLASMKALSIFSAMFSLRILPVKTLQRSRG